MICGDISSASFVSGNPLRIGEIKLKFSFLFLELAQNIIKWRKGSFFPLIKRFSFLLFFSQAKDIATQLVRQMKMKLMALFTFPAKVAFGNLMGDLPPRRIWLPINRRRRLQQRLRYQGEKQFFSCSFSDNYICVGAFFLHWKQSSYNAVENF